MEAEVKKSELIQQEIGQLNNIISDLKDNGKPERIAFVYKWGTTTLKVEKRNVDAVVAALELIAKDQIKALEVEYEKVKQQEDGEGV